MTTSNNSNSNPENLNNQFWDDPTQPSNVSIIKNNTDFSSSTPSFGFSQDQMQSTSSNLSTTENQSTASFVNAPTKIDSDQSQNRSSQLDQENQNISNNQPGNQNQQKFYGQPLSKLDQDWSDQEWDQVNSDPQSSYVHQAHFNQNLRLNEQPNFTAQQQSTFQPKFNFHLNTTLQKVLVIGGIVLGVIVVIGTTMFLSNQITQNQNKEVIQTILAQAQELADQKDPKKALEVIDQGLSKHPNNEELKKRKEYYENAVEISNILDQATSEEQDNPPEALAILASGLERYPNDASLQQAQRTLKTNLKLDALEAAMHYEEAQNYEKALSVLDQAIAMVGQEEDLVQHRQQVTNKFQEKENLKNQPVKTPSTSSNPNTPTPTPSTPTLSSPSSPNDDFVLANSSSQLYSYSEVAQMVHSQTDLELAINEIYARNGRTFDTPKYKSYFESQSWYSPLYSSSTFDANRDTLLSPIELQNIETLVAYGQNQGWR